MKAALLCLEICAACSPSVAADPGAVAAPQSRSFYPTQLSAPVPDYAELIAKPPARPSGELRRRAQVAAPRDAKAIGRAWIERLMARQALGGYGMAGKASDGPIDAIDTLLTASEFDGWVEANGWTMPRHIDWSFQPELVRPTVSESAAAAVRLWTASEARTGAQLQALEAGRIVMRDGCLWVSQAGRPDRIAWLHAETGLDRDSDGYLTLVDRVTGEFMGRLGEELVWAGPNRLDAPDWKIADARQVCGQADVFPVGNPQSVDRMAAQYPHLQSGGRSVRGVDGARR